MKLTKYAEFLDSSPSYVVTEALKLVCSEDKEFQSWLLDQHTHVPYFDCNACVACNEAA